MISLLVPLAIVGSLVGVGSTASLTSSGRHVWLGHVALTGDLSSWNAQVESPGLKAVTCTSDSTCIVVGAAADNSSGIVEVTTDGGTSWTQGSLPSGTTPLGSVGCASSSTCYATSSAALLVSTNSGASWSQVSLPGSISDLDGIACPSSSTCVVGGENASTYPLAIYTTNSGGSWSSSTVDTKTFSPVGISCFSVSSCIYIGDNSGGLPSSIYLSSGGFSSWVDEKDTSNALGAVSCSSSSTCMVVGAFSTALVTINGGSTWSSQASGLSAIGDQLLLQSLSCIWGTTNCVTVGGGGDLINTIGNASYVTAAAIFTTSDEGSSWTDAESGPPYEVSSLDRRYLMGVSCLSALDCVAVGGGGVLVTTDGSSWAQHSAVLSLNFSISCPTSQICYEVMADGVIDKTVDAGAHWDSIATPFEGGLIDCPSASDCAVLASVYVAPQGRQAVFSTVDGAQTWNANWFGNPEWNMSGLSCLSTSLCAVSGTGVPADPDNPDEAVFATGALGSGQWANFPSIPSDLATNYDLDGLSCAPSAGVCFITVRGQDSGATVELVELSGSGLSTWTNLSVPPGIDNLGDIGCDPSATVCYIEGGNGQLLQGVAGSPGFTFTAATQPGSISDITCPSASTCIMSGWVSQDTGAVFVDTDADGSGSWATDSGPSDGAEMMSISCSDPTDCWAAGYSANLESGVVWSTNGVGGPGSNIDGGQNADASLQSAESRAAGRSMRHDPGCNWGARPVNCSSGDFWHTFTDASIAGYGPALDLTRTYNSLNASTSGIFGYGWSSSYDMNLVVNQDSSVTITEEDGSQVTATPNGDGTYDVPAWADSSLTKNQDGTYTFVRQGTETFTFSPSGQLISIADADGATTTLSYSSGKLASVKDPSGRTLTFAFGSNGLVSSVTDPMGRQTTYGYDSSGDLIAVTDPLARVTRFTYGASHLLLTMTDPDGGMTTNSYDDGGRVITQSHPMGRVTNFAYSGDNFSPSGGTTTITDPDGNVTVEEYVNGELVSLTKASGTASAATSTYGYDAVSVGTTKVTDPDGHVSTATYDADGNQLTSTNANGAESTFAYNGFNEQTCATTALATSGCADLSPPPAVRAGESTITPPSSIPPLGVTYSEYDTLGNLIWRTTGIYAPGSTSTTHARTAYDLYNGESVAIGSNNETCTTAAPSTELACATIDPDSVVTQLSYDSYGNLTSTSTPDGNGSQLATTTTTYDADSEPTVVVSADGNVSGANAADYTTTTTYDNDGEKTEVTQGALGASVTPRSTSYTYDGDGDATSVSRSDSVRLVGMASGGNNGATDYVDLAYPTGTEANDEAVMAISTSYGSPNDVYSVPGGWTLYGTYESGTNGYDNETRIYTHTVSSLEQGVPVSFSSYSGKTLYLAVYRGVDTSDPIDVASSQSGGAKELTAASMSTSYANDELVGFGTAVNQGGKGSWEVPTGMTMQTEMMSTYISGYAADGQGPQAPGSTQAFTATMSSGGSLCDIVLALRPAPSDTTTTTVTTYDADSEKVSVTNADGQSTFYTYDGDGELTSRSDPIQLVGTSNLGEPGYKDSLSMSYPPHTEPGDVALVATTLPYGESVTTPSGYAILSTQNSCTQSGCLYTILYDHVVAPGDTTGPVTLDYSTWDEKVATLAVYSGVDPTALTDAGIGAANGSTTATSLSIPAASVPAPGSTLVAFFGAVSWNATGVGGWTPPAGTAMVAQVNDGENFGQLTVGQGPVPAGSTDPLTAAQSSEGPLAGILVGLQPDVTTYAYDPLGDLGSVTLPAPAGESTTETTTYTYDGDQRLVEMSAPPTSSASGTPDETTTYTYDAIGQLRATTSAYGTSAASTTSYCYDPQGDRTAAVPGDGNISGVASCSTTSPWQTTSPYETGYDYDSLGHMVAQLTPATSADPDGGTTTYSYDSAGNRLSSSDPGGVTTTDTYTPNDLLASVSYSGSSAHPVAYTYDAQGDRLEMSDGSGTSTYSFDPFGEMTSDQNGAGDTTTFTYDLLGDLIKLTYPLSSQSASWTSNDSVTYAYDSAGEPTAVSDFSGTTTNFVNTPTGEPQAMSLGSSGDTVVTTYDGQGDPSSINLEADSSGSSLLGFSYSLEPSASIATETDVPTGPASPAAYGYDAQSRVNQMTAGTASPTDYSYDASGNLATLPSGAAASYDDAGQLTSSVASSTTTDYTYDQDGDRTVAQGATTTFGATYNGAHELTGVSSSGADITSATYNGNGLRTAITTSSGGEASQSFTWDESRGSARLLMDGSNAYIYGPTTTPIEQVNLATGTQQFLVSDALGSVRGVVGASGSLSASTSYDAWGNPQTTGGLGNYTPFGFAGGYSDSTGLYYLLDRYYDPSTGQFLSVDPDVAETGQPYAYAGDDPVNETDPLGLWGWNPISDVTQAAGDVGGAVEHHWRGIAQVAIAATAVTVAVVSVGSLSGVSAVLAGAAIGAVSSGVSYDVGCVGTSGGCTATGVVAAILVGGVSGGAAAGVGGLVCGDSSLCLSAVGVGIGAGTATGGYYAANELEGACSSGNGALSAAESGLGGVSASQSDWNTVWNDLKRALTGGSGGDE